MGYFAQDMVLALKTKEWSVLGTTTESQGVVKSTKFLFTFAILPQRCLCMKVHHHNVYNFHKGYRVSQNQW